MKKISAGHWQLIFLFLFVFFGGWLRFAPTIISGNVINDGGMFYSMVQELHDNHYIIPNLVTYNGLNVPFAYPPLPFYMVAMLSDLFGVPFIEIFRWFPAIVSTLSILAFYLLARTMLKSPATAVLATGAFAFLPRAYTWFVMGGGVSRAMGQIFFLLTVWSAYQLFSNKQVKHVISTCLFGALVALSHPSYCLHTIVICVILWLFLDRRAFSRALIVALGVGLLTVPWWLVIVLRYGFGPFLSASQTGGLSALSWLPLVIPTFAEEQFLTPFTIFGLMGLASQLIRRKYLLAIFLIIPFMVDPRSGPSIAVIPLAMLAGIGLNDLVLPSIAAILPSAEGENELPLHFDWAELFATHRSIQGILAYFLFIALLGAYAYNQPLAKTIVPETSREALAWVRKNTPSDSSFIVMTGINDPFADPLQEWFPVFAGRRSVTTVQGREWELGRDFLSYYNSLSNLENCLNSDLACVNKWAEAQNISYDYLFLLKSPPASKTADFENFLPLAYSLRNSPDYELVYEMKEVVIFARTHVNR